MSFLQDQFNSTYNMYMKKENDAYRLGDAGAGQKVVGRTQSGQCQDSNMVQIYVGK